MGFLKRMVSSPRFDPLTKIATVLIALVSLFVSMSTLIIRPSVEMNLPPGARVGMNSLKQAEIVVQPTFVNTGRSTRVEVIKDIKVEIKPEQSETPAEFTTVQYAKFGTAQDPDLQSKGFILSQEWASDAIPLVIAPNTPQLPFVRCVAPEEWAFEEGSYLVTVTAQRSVRGDTLREEAKLTLNEEQISFIEDNAGTGYLSVLTEATS